MTVGQTQLRSPPRRTATSSTGGLVIYYLLWCFEKQVKKKHRALRGLLLRRDDKYPPKIMNTSPLLTDQGAGGTCSRVPGCSALPALAKDQGWEEEDGLSLQGLHCGTWKTFKHLCCSSAPLPEAPLNALPVTSTPQPLPHNYTCLQARLPVLKNV